MFALLADGLNIPMHAHAFFFFKQKTAYEITRSGTNAFFFSTLAALGVWVAVLGARRRRLSEAFLLTALAAIMTLDLARANLGAYHIGPEELATLIPPFAQAISAREGGVVPGRFRMI